MSCFAELCRGRRTTKEPRDGGSFSASEGPALLPLLRRARARRRTGFAAALSSSAQPTTWFNYAISVELVQEAVHSAVDNLAPGSVPSLDRRAALL